MHTTFEQLKRKVPEVDIYTALNRVFYMLPANRIDFNNIPIVTIFSRYTLTLEYRHTHFVYKLHDVRTSATVSGTIEYRDKNIEPDRFIRHSLENLVSFRSMIREGQCVTS